MDLVLVTHTDTMDCMDTAWATDTHTMDTMELTDILSTVETKLKKQFKFMYFFIKNGIR